MNHENPEPAPAAAAAGQPSALRTVLRAVFAALIALIVAAGVALEIRGFRLGNLFHANTWDPQGMRRFVHYIAVFLVAAVPVMVVRAVVLHRPGRWIGGPGHGARGRSAGCSGGGALSDFGLRAGLAPAGPRPGQLASRPGTRHHGGHGRLHLPDDVAVAAPGELPAGLGSAAGHPHRLGPGRRPPPARGLRRLGAPGGTAIMGRTRGRGSAGLRAGNALAGGAQTGSGRRRAGHALGHSRQSSRRITA